jgi:hypothetical protein
MESSTPLQASSLARSTLTLICSAVQVKSDDDVLEISSPGGGRLYYLLRCYCNERFIKSGSNLEKAYLTHLILKREEKLNRKSRHTMAEVVEHCRIHITDAAAGWYENHLKNKKYDGKEFDGEVGKHDVPESGLCTKQDDTHYDRP